MGIFKIKKPVKKYNERDTDQKLMWVYLDKFTRSYMALLSLSSEKGRSSLIREVLQEWMDNQSDNKYDVVKKLVDKAVEEFNKRWDSNYYPKSSWESNFEKDRAINQFSEELVMDLQKKGLLIEDVNSIKEQFLKVINGQKNKKSKRSSKVKG